jgi:hypothetical protein
MVGQQYPLRHQLRIIVDFSEQPVISVVGRVLGGYGMMHHRTDYVVVVELVPVVVELPDGTLMALCARSNHAVAVKKGQSRHAMDFPSSSL